MALAAMQRSRTCCIEVRGADAAAFLHGQLSHAVVELDPARTRRSPAGPTRAAACAPCSGSCPLPERWLLVTPRDGADALVKKLRMFVLRSKVDLVARAPMSPWRRCSATPSVARAARRRGRHAAEPTGAPRRSSASSASAKAYWQALGAPAALARLAAGSIARQPKRPRRSPRSGSGIPAITPAVADRFVAQMLNLDELGAVSFDKGCYPGQEIIARVHNLGGVKRRARRYAARNRTARARRSGARGRRARSRRGRACSAAPQRAASCSPSSTMPRRARR